MASLSTFGQRLKTIVNGYIRHQNKSWKINIPKEINEIIYLFYKIMIDSKILTEEENFTLCEMILEKLQSKALSTSLIYRATENGFGYDDFWNKCENINPALVIIQTTKDKVCGGYTSVGFRKDKGRYYKDEDAFIYSIRTNDSNYPPKIFPVSNEQKAMSFCNGYLCCWSNSGIWLQENCNKPNTNSGISGLNYVPTGSDAYLNAGVDAYNGLCDNIQIEDIELFHIVFE